jgi:HD-GYP domain-containing protein (c-di-GMP phosphodiesterase class II)
MKSTWEEALFRNLFRMIQAIRIHRDNNQLVKLCVSEFEETIRRLDFQEDITVQISKGRLFVQGEKIHHGNEAARLIGSMLDFFQRRGLEGLRLHPELMQAPEESVLSFMRLFAQCVEKEDPAGWLMEQAGDGSFPWVTVLKSTEAKRSPTEDLREKAKSTYYHAMNSVKDIAQRISFQGSAGIRKSRRMVQNMLDCLSEDEAVFLGLSTIKSYDDYTYTHSVNVAVLSLCLGNRIGLSRNSLGHLGICGLFHDLGKIDVPREILKKPGKLTEDEWVEMKKHPMTGVVQILKLQASHEIRSKILLGPFEHHLKYDLSGYPRLNLKRSISLFGRILQIADVYDAITSARAYRQHALTPDQAICHMMSRAGKDYDPLLLKVFAIMMGTYPVGSLLALDTGELGVVVDYPMETGANYPRVILLDEDEKGNLIRGTTVSLSEKNKDTGRLRRKIVHSLNPADYGIQPARFILG